MQNLNSCNCCEGLPVQTPVQIYNRPGLPAIAYRAGVHSLFRAGMLAGLSGFPALRRLTSRADDDFTIALLDAWATVSDVLTFYQERIANESYFGTATEQFSIVSLAALISYRLKPGVAAGAFLTFQLDDAAVIAGDLLRPEATVPVMIDAGIKVQSIPGHNEQAQTFETIESIEGRAEWNAMKPLLIRPGLPLTQHHIIVVDGMANDLKPGDVLLIAASLTLKKIVKIRLDDTSRTTWIYTGDADTFPEFELPALIPDSTVNIFQEKMPFSKAVVEEITGKIWLEEDLSMLIRSQGWPMHHLREGMKASLDAQETAAQCLFVFRKQASVFGYNALKQVTYDPGRNVPRPQSDWMEWPLDEQPDTIFLDSSYDQILPGTYIAVRKAADHIENAAVYLVSDAAACPRTAYGLSAKSTAITIIPDQTPWWENGHTYTSDLFFEQRHKNSKAPHHGHKNEEADLSAIRSVSIHAQAVPLRLAGLPVTEEISGDQIMLDRYYPGLKKGRKVTLSGSRSDLQAGRSCEVSTLKEVLIVHGFTVLVFEQPLLHTYIRSSVSINANTVAATHGETVKEVLGSGDSRRSFQKFMLKQPPQTYISAGSADGTQPTLEIRVNDLLWQEVPSLYGRGPGEHIYSTRQDEDGRTTVMFGDGRHGARLPTGQENIKATYRKGIGSGGQVKANQLSQLLSRPLGIKGVDNPLPAGGAQDRELLADARRNARLPVFTLDRIVSLRDYEDFARAFAGISKALASRTWTGQKMAVHITVAGNDGAAVAAGSPLYNNLLTAIQKSGIPGVPVTVGSFQERFFRVGAKVQTHPDYISGNVLKAVSDQLRTTFSFSARSFGQPVIFSEVISVMQNVAGVTAVDIDELYRSDMPAGLITDRIGAAASRLAAGGILPAELLTIDERPITLNLMS